MGKIKAGRRNRREKFGISAQRPVPSDQFEGERSVFSQLTGAFVRALLVLVLIATPSVLLPGVGSDSAQVVFLVAIFGSP